MREVHIHLRAGRLIQDTLKDWDARRESDEWYVFEKIPPKRDIRFDASEASSRAEAVKVGREKLGVNDAWKATKRAGGSKDHRVCGCRASGSTR